MKMTMTKICMACGNSAIGDHYDPMHLVNNENICPACGNEWTTLAITQNCKILYSTIIIKNLRRV